MFWLHKGEGFSAYASRRASRKRRMHRVPMIGTGRSVPRPAGRWERAAGAGAQCRVCFLSPKPPDAHVGHGACGPDTYSLPGGRGSCFT